MIHLRTLPQLIQGMLGTSLGSTLGVEEKRSRAEMKMSESQEKMEAERKAKHARDKIVV